VVNLNDLSKISFLTGNYDSSLYYCNQAKLLSEKISWKKGLAQSFNNLGLVYKNQGIYAEALKNHFAALRLREELDDLKGVASSNNNIGNVYQNQGNFNEALKHHFISLKMHKESGNAFGLAGSYNNIGSLYKDMRRYPEALSYQLEALKIREKIGDKKNLAYSYTNIGNVYQGMRNYTGALKNYNAALKLLDENEKLALSTTYINMSNVYFKLKQYSEAESFASKALSITQEIGELEGIKDAWHCLSDVYNATAQYDKALNSYRAFIGARDSLMNEESTKKSVRLEMNYEFEKKEAAARLDTEKKEAIATAESHKQKVIIFSVCGVLILVLGFALFAYRSYLQKRKANLAILMQKQIIEEKQKEILDSIQYAKRIQTALMPSDRSIEKNLRRLSSRNK
jgi:tetratricopeptide (TPR) repeat protein